MMKALFPYFFAELSSPALYQGGEGLKRLSRLSLKELSSPAFVKGADLMRLSALTYYLNSSCH
jgi:hypothetical protein